MERIGRFRLGQLVECIDDTAGPVSVPNAVPEMDGLKKGQIYTVRWAGKAITADGSVFDGLRLMEIWRPARDSHIVDLPYFARRFRPVDDRRLDVFRKMLVTSKEEA